MKEAEDNKQGQKARISKLAIASVVIPLLVFSGWHLYIMLIRNKPIQDGRVGNSGDFLGFVLFWITLLVLLAGLILASYSSIKIKKSKGMLRGYVFSILGVPLTIVAPLLGASIGWVVIREIAPVVICQRNMQDIYSALRLYESNWDGEYPPTKEWCDLLAEQKHMSQLPFECPKERKEPDFYIMNHNAKPNSPPDTVLLFEGMGYRNESGEVDKLTLENHHSFGKGCNILFNDGRVEYLRPEELGDLNWGDGTKE